jgi:hypothetical protein
VMLAVPIATFFLDDADTGPLGLAGIFVDAVPLVAGSATSGPLNVLPWLVQAWFCGVFLFSLRLAGGVLLLERTRRGPSTSPGAEVLALCRALQQQLGLSRTIRYLECDWLQAPAVMGWLRPVILLPITALTGFSQEQLGAVIAHELAHIRRHDAFVNLFQILAETLLFYHPAVWWLNRRIRATREICCDEIAVSLSGNRIAYARALTLMEEWKRAPVLAMAANHGLLSERVFLVLGRESADHGSRFLKLAGGLVLLGTALAAGNAALSISDPVVPAPIHFTELSLPAPQTRAMPQAPARVTKLSAVRHARARGRPRTEVRNQNPPPLPPPAEAKPSSDVAQTDSPLFQIRAPNPPVLIITPPSQTLASSSDPDPLVCRLPQQLPGSRLYGPRTCLTKSLWVQLRTRDEDISPDGGKLLQSASSDSGSIPDVRIWQGAKAQ